MNEKFFSLPQKKQQAIINAGYRVFSQNSYKNSPMSESALEAGSSKEPPSSCPATFSQKFSIIAATPP